MCRVVCQTASVSDARACCRGRAAHARSAEVVVVRAPSAGAAHQRQGARYHGQALLERVSDSVVGDVIDLGAPRPLRRNAADRRKPGHPARPLYIPNPRLYPGPRTKPKSRLQRAELRARANEGRGRRRKRVFRRPVPNSRLYRPAPPRPPPPPAWPRTTWAPPTPSARLETASRAALRLSEQRRGLHVLQRTVRVAQPVRPVSTPGRATRTLVRAAHSPVWTARSPVRTTHSPGRARRSPVRTTHYPGRARLSPRPECCLLPLPTARESPPPARESSPPARESSPPRRLVVTLPAPPAEPAQHYRPASEHFRLRTLDTDSGASTPVAGRPAARASAMDAPNQHSTSPEDCSEGNETLSAPSEFLAEFLSAIMRRQYAEALKYCRLILQYEPHNTTARGFYPLLQHKVQAHKRAEGGWVRGSSSEEASAHADKPQHAPEAQEMMEQGADESGGSAAASRSSSRSRGSCASQSSLELDSSDALAHSSPSLSLSRRTDQTDSASGGCWESSGSASRSEPDDNGNAPAAPSLPACAADVQNDNVVHVTASHKSESPASLRRLRAQFTCSIK